MNAKFSERFDKQYRKTPEEVKHAFKRRLDLFLSNPHHPLLHNHELKGAYKGCRSINITGDWRAIYREAEENLAYFVILGTHSQLY